MKYLTINLMILSLAVFLTTCADSSRKKTAEQKPSVRLPQIKSDPCNTIISVDGIDEEWRSGRSFVISNKTAVGVCKDDKFLYVHLSTSDPELSMQIINFGFYVWLDPQGIQKKTVGIQFPVIQMPPPPPREGNPPVGKELQRILDKRLKDIIIEFPENDDVRKMSTEEAKKQGINAKIGVEPGLLTYELQYPLHVSDAYNLGLGLSKQKQMNICIETPDIDLSKMAGPSADGPQPGEVTRLQNAASKELKPKPPKITRLSQWIEVLF
jgi:hypothetical protein